MCEGPMHPPAPEPLRRPSWRNLVTGFAHHTSATVLIAALLLVPLASRASFAGDPLLCDEPGEMPDLIVGNLHGVFRHGTTSGITGYSVGTDACNLGTCWLNWTGGSNKHPVIGQNMFRLKDGRFEQLGQSWVKHGFASDQALSCSTDCIPSPTWDHMGVNCSDLYASDENGFQTLMGPKGEVNPYTGYFPYPATDGNRTGNVIYKRLQVRNTDVDPALNPGARYFVEAQYITSDEGPQANTLNNASYRRVTVAAQGPTTFNVSVVDATHVGEAAIHAWKAQDPSVVETIGKVDGDGYYILAAKVTALGGGLYQYEFALQNVNASFGATAFSVPMPVGTSIAQVGFHDVDYHSGDLQDGTDWSGSTGAGGGAYVWNAALSVAPGLRPNVLAWGTLYNFRFVANAPAGTHDVILRFNSGTIPGSQPPSELRISTLTPSACDADGSCDPGETCAGCPSDCADQGGGGGCCGDGTCESGEDAQRCFIDCAPAAPTESNCADGRDDDRDGSVDCLDPDCCTDPACDAFDLDGDQRGICDCNDADPQAWTLPGEVQGIFVWKDGIGGTVLEWTGADGALVPPFDTIRTGTAGDFITNAVCLPTGDPTAHYVFDPELPLPSQVFYYLVRARDSCGYGSLGVDSSGAARTARVCP
jgi:hypothetical protein